MCPSLSSLLNLTLSPLVFWWPDSPEWTRAIDDRVGSKQVRRPFEKGVRNPKITQGKYAWTVEYLYNHSYPIPLTFCLLAKPACHAGKWPVLSFIEGMYFWHTQIIWIWQTTHAFAFDKWIQIGKLIALVYDDIQWVSMTWYPKSNAKKGQWGHEYRVTTVISQFL